jgi:hypothetical protein
MAGLSLTNRRVKRQCRGSTTSVSQSHTYNTRSHGFANPRKGGLTDVPAGRTAMATRVERSAISALSVSTFRAHTQSHTETLYQAIVVDTEGFAAGRRHDLAVDHEMAIRRPPSTFFVKLGDNSAN